MATRRRASTSLRRRIDAVIDRIVIRQAGGIVVRRGRYGPEVLLVTARRSRKRWVLPKGSVKRGEKATTAALREVREEAGVRGRVVGPAGTATYPTRDGIVHVQYFIVEYAKNGADAGEERDLLWCALEDAIARLTYASARRVLLEAYPRIAAHLAT